MLPNSRIDFFCTCEILCCSNLNTCTLLWCYVVWSSPARQRVLNTTWKSVGREGGEGWGWVGCVLITAPVDDSWIHRNKDDKWHLKPMVKIPERPKCLFPNSKCSASWKLTNTHNIYDHRNKRYDHWWNWSVHNSTRRQVENTILDTWIKYWEMKNQN